MKVSVGILNEGYEAEEEFIQYQNSGEPSDLPERIKEIITLAEVEDLDPGDWITVVDGEIVAAGYTHAFLVHAEAEE